MLLNMISHFFCVSFFKGVNGFIILFKIVNLFFELLQAIFKLFLNFHDIQLHLLAFLLVIFFKLDFLSLELFLIAFKRLLGFCAFRKMLPFNFFNFLFQRTLFGCLDQSVFLLRNSRIRLLK